MDGLSRSDWTAGEIAALYSQPFDQLLWEAQSTHRRREDRGSIQLHVKHAAGIDGDAEDRGGSLAVAGGAIGVAVATRLDVRRVLRAASAAKADGAHRFCIAAPTRGIHERELRIMVEMVEGTRMLGLEASVAPGLLTRRQAEILGAAGLDHYHCDLVAGPDRMLSRGRVSASRDQSATLDHVRNAGIGISCGMRIGAGENRSARIELLHTLVARSRHPETVAMDLGLGIAGSARPPAPARASASSLDDLELVRTVAVARILLPQAIIRLPAAAGGASEAVQALCFAAGANAVSARDSGDREARRTDRADASVFPRLGLEPVPARDALEMELFQ